MRCWASHVYLSFLNLERGYPTGLTLHERTEITLKVRAEMNHTHTAMAPVIIPWLPQHLQVEDSDIFLKGLSQSTGCSHIAVVGKCAPQLGCEGAEKDSEGWWYSWRVWVWILVQVLLIKAYVSVVKLYFHPLWLLFNKWHYPMGGLWSHCAFLEGLTAPYAWGTAWTSWSHNKPTGPPAAPTSAPQDPTG